MTELCDPLERSLSMDTDTRMDTYQRCVRNGKDAARQGDLWGALEAFRQAHNLLPSQKLEARIKKMEELMLQEESVDEDEEFVDVNGSGLLLFRELHDKLYGYQREGVAFLYSLHRDGRGGGILADDMGLGKTIQVISFLSGMYDAELVRHALLVMPASLLTNWAQEFARWTPGMRVKDFHGTSRIARGRNLERVQSRSGVVLTTYQMMVNNWQQLASYQGCEFRWDYMILDEAHKIKTTSTKTAKSAAAIPAKNRILLTGTPVQNNLREMWALFDFACQGALLGTAKTFKAEYENPITRARERDATLGEKALGSRMSENLMAIIRPHFLRRTKAEVQKETRASQADKEDANQGQLDQRGRPRAEMPKLTRKNDLIVWTFLSPVQEEIYRQFLSLDHVKELLSTTRSPLAELTILKKLCDHPRLLSAAVFTKLGLEENQQDGDEADDAIQAVDRIPDQTLISESGKLTFLVGLLERLREEGHRTLVFSHYRKVLDIIQRILTNRSFRVMRMDGTITQLAERQKRISQFQSDQSFSVFLLTTQVGGVGITLTGADRVVIYDPSWNPATDAQAVDRAYRIGQTENVVIYRLITCGTVEEKIYRRQVFKDSLIRQNTGDKKNPFRYFSKQELKELFILEDTRSSSTQLQLQAMHALHRRTDAQLDRHIAHLHRLRMFGISDHDLMFSEDMQQEDEAPKDQERDYISGRVQRAQELMKAESQLQQELALSMATSTEPAWLRALDGPPSGRIRHMGAADTPQRLGGDLQVIDLTEGQTDTHGEQEAAAPDGGKELLEMSEMRGSAHASQLSAAKESAMSEGGGAPGMAAWEATSTKLSEANQRKNLETAENEGNVHVSLLQSRSSMFLHDSHDGLNSPTSVAQGSQLESLHNNFILQLDDSDMLSEEEPDGQSRDRLSSGAESTEQSGGELSTGTEATGQSDNELSIGAEPTGQSEDKPSSGAERDCQNVDEALSGAGSGGQSDGEEIFSGVEQEEMELLSQLQMKSSFSVDRSLLLHSSRMELSEDEDGDDDGDGSPIVPQRRRAVVISDSEEDDDGLGLTKMNASIQALGASTPKASLATPPVPRKSVGANASLASRRSFFASILEDEEEEPETDEEEEVEEEEQQQQEKEEGEEEFQLEESPSRPERSEELEELTGDMELGSTERAEPFTAGPAAPLTPCSDRPAGGDQAEGSYCSLVCRGRQCYTEGRLQEALCCFLQAIDLQPGDPEVQLLTIQLYRRLSKLTNGPVS